MKMLLRICFMSEDMAKVVNGGNMTFLDKELRAKIKAWRSSLPNLPLTLEARDLEPLPIDKCFITGAPSATQYRVYATVCEHSPEDIAEWLKFKLNSLEINDLDAAIELCEPFHNHPEAVSRAIQKLTNNGIITGEES